MAQYEYQRFIEPNITAAQIPDFLNTLGAQGWEVFQKEYANNAFIFYAKRAIPENSLDLAKLDSMLDTALAKETPESLNTFINAVQNNDLDIDIIKNCVYLIHQQYTDMIKSYNGLLQGNDQTAIMEDLRDEYNMNLAYYTRLDETLNKLSKL